jgi:hypothetical protein
VAVWHGVLVCWATVGLLASLVIGRMCARTDGDERTERSALVVADADDVPVPVLCSTAA